MRTNERRPGRGPEAAESLAADTILPDAADNPRHANLGAWATWYASQGIPVFPLRPGHKKPLTEHGLNDATTDVATITLWWQRHPDANIGAATGVVFDCIDVDGPEGAASLDALYPSGWPATIASDRTPRPGGTHLFVPPMGAPVKANLHPSVDTRGAGGYVVLPPSTLVELRDADNQIEQHAGTYAWNGETPTFGPAQLATVRACKPWRRVWEASAPVATPTAPRAPLAPSQGTTRYGVRVLDAEAATVATAGRGGRNDALNRAAYKVGQLVPHEVTEADAAAALLDAARACGLPDAEARATLASGLRNGKGNPRRPEERDTSNPLAGLLPSSSTPSTTTSTTTSTKTSAIPGGSVVLDDVRRWLGRYLLTVSDGDLDLLTLWAAHTHLVAETYTTPRLLLDSPVPGSGKTTALEHLARLCVNPVQMAAVSSPALLTRILEDGVRTLLIDEADRTLRPDKDGTPDLLALLNAGYKRGATRPVLVPEKGGGWVPREMPCFAPVCMAGNSPNLPEDTRSRTIRVLLLPDLDGVVEESDWELIEDTARQLGDVLAAWADLHRAEVSTARPAMPEGIVGRFREKWQPLARVAAAAAGRWPGVVDALARQDREQVEMDREDGMVTTRPHVLLLQHLAEVWPGDEVFASTAELVDQLVREHPTVWGDASPYGKALTVQRCGRMMAQHFKVNTGRADDPARTRGYFAAALVPVWTRMGVHPPVETGQTGRTGRTGQDQPVAPSGSSGSSGLTGSGETPEEPVDTRFDLDPDLLDGDGRCRVHHDEPVVGACWTCDQLAARPVRQV